MKRRFLPILLCSVFFSGCTAVPPAVPSPDPQPSSLTEEASSLIPDLMPEDYRDMTVTEFRNALLPVLDRPEMHEWQERLSCENPFYEIHDSNPLASYYYNVLEPLTAEQWEIHDFSGSCGTDAVLTEYVVNLRVTDPDRVLVGRYEDAPQAAADTFRQALENHTTPSDAELAGLTRTLSEAWSTEGLAMSIDWKIQSDPPDIEGPSEASAETSDPRMCPPSTEEDYMELLTLMTPGWDQESVKDFNARLLRWTDEHPDISERIDADRISGIRPALLTEEQREFTKNTLWFSGTENGRQVQSLYTGEELLPVLDIRLPEKLDMGEQHSAVWADLQCRFEYRIMDPESLKVGERDRILLDLSEAVNELWDGWTAEEVLALDTPSILGEFARLAAAAETENIRIYPLEDQVILHSMDERSPAEKPDSPD